MKFMCIFSVKLCSFCNFEIIVNTILTISICCVKPPVNHELQARNQKFFKKGEVSWNQSTLRNISLKKTRKRGPVGNNFGVFSPRYY